MKRVLLISLVGIILFSACSTSPRLSQISSLPIGAVLNDFNYDIDKYIEQYPDDDAVYLFNEEYYEHSGAKGQYIASWSYHHISKSRYILLNRNNDVLTSFAFRMSNRRTIDAFYLITYSPSGEYKKYNLSDLNKNSSIDGIVEYKFAYPDVTEGTIIEEYISTTTKSYSLIPPTYHTFNIQNYYPCEKVKITFAYPDWWKVSFKNTPGSEQKKMIKSLNDDFSKVIYTYEAENIPAYKSEPYSPIYSELAKYVECMVTELDMNYRYRAPKAWLNVAADLESELVDNDRFLVSSVDNKCEEILVGVKTHFDTIKTIISYIQQNIKIAEDYEDRNFSEIIEDRMGSIYEICGLAIAMLEEANIASDYILVHSEVDGPFDENFVSASQFRIPAVRISADSSYLISLPFSKYLPITLLPDFLENQPSLILKEVKPDYWAYKNPDDDKESLKKIFWEVPSNSGTINTINEDYKITIDENGKVLVTELRELEGYFAYDMRNDFNDLTEDELVDTIKSYLKYSDGEVILKDYEITNLDNIYETLKLQIDYEIDNLVTVLPEEVIFQTSGLLSPSTYFSLKFDTEERVNPIKISYGEKINKNITLSFPKEWKLSTELEAIEQESIFGNLKGDYNYSEGVLEINQTKSLNKCYEPKEKFDEFLKISGSNSKLAVPTLVFTRN